MIDEKKLIEYVKNGREEMYEKWERYNDQTYFGEYCAFFLVLRYIERLIRENDESTM